MKFKHIDKTMALLIALLCSLMPLWIVLIKNSCNSDQDKHAMDSLFVHLNIPAVCFLEFLYWLGFLTKNQNPMPVLAILVLYWMIIGCVAYFAILMALKKFSTSLS